MFAVMINCRTGSRDFTSKNGGCWVDNYNTITWTIKNTFEEASEEVLNLTKAFNPQVRDVFIEQR